jgi:superfamily II DNA or RNA helicase
MPKIFDNIERSLLPALEKTLKISYRADFCVGYFNLRGWQKLDEQIENWTGGDGAQCRLLVGMYRRPKEELRTAFGFQLDQGRIDNKRANELKKELAQEFRQQLMIGAPSNRDEAGLRRLLAQLREKKLVVQLFLRYPLHAKLYLLFREDIATPTIGYMGSSNLTFSGLSGQGELNLDVLEQDAANKLATWFEDRWDDKWCIDITDDIIDVLEESWASEQLTPPYHIYLKMAYHLSREARAGLTEFSIPRVFGNKLFDYQVAAVKIAARHLNERGGVLIGDVVGLGKTIMATALAKIFEDDFSIDTLIICPKNLVKMWEYYRDEYRLRARVLSITRVQNELPDMRRYRLVLIDESHNLRNREGKRYHEIQEYIQRNESRCILLSATPYNKTYLDLSSQLRLFMPEDADLGIRPERLLREIGEVEFSTRHQAPLRSLQAFEKSEYPDDWRELMRLFMVRRTRSFIRDNYAETDSKNGRKYLVYPDGGRDYFPARRPKRATFKLDENNPDDQYARLYREDVVNTINDLNLPRYGLGNHINEKETPTAKEKSILNDLSRGGRRLMGFCRTNLFKRLESSGIAFLLSVERHILRNYVFIHALENNLPVPIGTQGAEMLDTQFEDGDADAVLYNSARLFDDATVELESDETDTVDAPLHSEEAFKKRASEIYSLYDGRFQRRFKWLRPELFQKKLTGKLREDAENLLLILQVCGEWQPDKDTKLKKIYNLITEEYPDEKILVFSQFADTVNYLESQLKDLEVDKLSGVTGGSADPTEMAWRFSPVSNEKREEISAEDELRVLISTDVLSEGQNLQDSHIVVNYDLPWAIIRLIQRAGRVDRIGQKSPDIYVYMFWPTEGVEKIIDLRGRLRRRLQENAEVVGSDEAFFEDDDNPEPLKDLYNETAGALDEDEDTEVDLVSHAYQIWKNATDANPDLKKLIPRMPSVVFSTKAHEKNRENGPCGVLVYIKNERGTHSLAWIDEEGKSVTESQFAVLRAARCSIDTLALPRMEKHHKMVKQGVTHIMAERKHVGGQLGRPSGARFKTFVRLKDYAERHIRGNLFESLPENQSLLKAIEQIHRFPVREAARVKLNRQLRSNVRDEQLAQLVVTLYDEDKLCLVQDEAQTDEPEIICSLGLKPIGEIE